MKRLAILTISLCMLWACNESPSNIDTNQEVTSSGLPDEANIQRIVCFKFKPGTDPEAIRQHMRGFMGLKDSISYILSYHAGPTVKGDLSEDPEYDVMHYCTYRNEEEINLYAVHPVHKRFIEQNSAIWEKVLVINSRVRQ